MAQLTTEEQMQEALTRVHKRIEDTELTLEVGKVTTGDPGTNAEVSNSGTERDIVLDFTIPRGDQGYDGDPGPEGESAYEVAVSQGFSGSEDEWLASLKGSAASITIGSVTTGEPGTDAEVTNSGTDSDVILDFTIPRGEQGDSADIHYASRPETIYISSNQDTFAYVEGIKTIFLPESITEEDFDYHEDEHTIYYSEESGVFEYDEDARTIYVDDLEINSGVHGYVSNFVNLDTGDEADVRDTEAHERIDELVKLINQMQETFTATIVGLQDQITEILDNLGEENVIEIIRVNGEDLPVEDKAVDIIVPSAVSELINDANYVTAEAIPTELSELTNDTGYITSEDIPTEVSEFNNDAGYITIDSVPSYTSQLENDSGYITMDDVPPDTSALEYDEDDRTIYYTE